MQRVALAFATSSAISLGPATGADDTGTAPQARPRTLVALRSQFTPELLQKLGPVRRQAWNGRIAFVPGASGTIGTDLFR